MAIGFLLALCASFPTMAGTLTSVESYVYDQDGNQAHPWDSILTARNGMPDKVNLDSYSWDSPAIDSSAPLSLGGTYGGLSVNSYAFADPLSKSLHAESMVSPIAGPTASSAFTIASAMIGDIVHIRSLSGGAYDWNASQSLVTLHLHLDGQLSSLIGNGWRVGFSFYGLSPTTGKPSNDSYIGGLEFRTPYDPDRAADAFPFDSNGGGLWNPGPDGHDYQFSGRASGTLTDADITLSWNPGQDFFWTLSLSTWASGWSGQTGASFSDFSHTLGFSYQGPPGSVTTSESGINYTAASVPEPSSLALLLAGGSSLLIFARRKQRPSQLGRHDTQLEA